MPAFPPNLAAETNAHIGLLQAQLVALQAALAVAGHVPTQLQLQRRHALPQAIQALQSCVAQLGLLHAAANALPAAAAVSAAATAAAGVHPYAAAAVGAQLGRLDALGKAIEFVRFALKQLTQRITTARQIGADQVLL